MFAISFPERVAGGLVNFPVVNLQRWERGLGPPPVWQ
jgi:hypothetical protein